MYRALVGTRLLAFMIAPRPSGVSSFVPREPLTFPDEGPEGNGVQTRLSRFAERTLESTKIFPYLPLGWLPYCFERRPEHTRLRMNISGIRFGLALSLAICVSSFAGVSPKIITEPNRYSFSPGAYYADENATNVSLTVILHPGNPTMQGAVGYYSKDGTAVAGRDYAAVSGIAMPSVIPAAVNVPLYPSISPTNKTFHLLLSNPGTSPSDWIATVTIKAAPLALAIALPLTPTIFKLTAIAQAEKLDVVGTKTSPTRAATNITQLTRSTLTNSAFGTSEMLLLLQNSFNTNFPSGARIAFSMNHLYVVDSTGTNMIMDPGGVVCLDFG